MKIIFGTLRVADLIASNNLKWNLVKMLHVTNCNRRYKLVTILSNLCLGNVTGIAKDDPKYVFLPRIQFGKKKLER